MESQDENELGQMTNITATSVYGKNLQISSSEKND